MITCPHATSDCRTSLRGLYQHRRRVPSRALTGRPVSRACVGVRPVGRLSSCTGCIRLQPMRRRMGESTDMQTMGHSTCAGLLVFVWISVDSKGH